MKLIMKFGGTSVGTGPRIRKVAEMIQTYRGEGHQVVAVVSALDGVTEELIKAAEHCQKGDGPFLEYFRKAVLGKHLAVAEAAISDPGVLRTAIDDISDKVAELHKVLTGVAYVREVTPKSRDNILSFGERLSIPIVAGALESIGVPTKCLTGGEAGILTDSNFGEARPLKGVTQAEVEKRISSLLSSGRVPVIAGFTGETQEGAITTLGRGGSDYTATLVGAAVSADEVWIWTDVDGLMTCDPRIMPSSRVLPELSFQEAVEMIVFGAKAMHPRALEPAMEAGIPVRIRNVFNPANPGTLIVREQKVRARNPVKAMTVAKDVAVVTISGAGIVGVPGTAAKVFDILGRNGINIMMISQSVSEANISLVIKESVLEKAVSALEISLLGGGLIREVASDDQVCVVSVVGAGVQDTPGVAARVFSSVSKRGVNVRMIAQGSSEMGLSLVVKESDSMRAIGAIHEEFELSSS
jgi:aspartate kinase